jgi:hypothetical protein
MKGAFAICLDVYSTCLVMVASTALRRRLAVYRRRT